MLIASHYRNQSAGLFNLYSAVLHPFRIKKAKVNVALLEVTCYEIVLKKILSLQNFCSAEIYTAAEKLARLPKHWLRAQRVQNMIMPSLEVLEISSHRETSVLHGPTHNPGHIYQIR